MSKARSLYLHYPFCETKCHYCDFYSLGRERTRPEDARLFEKALAREVELRSTALDSEIDTIFMGGGTPSMTPPESMAQTIAPLWKHTRLSSKIEWTMEANPSSVDRKRLEDYRQLGVNRISMGVQALRDDLLLKLGRVHSRSAALHALENIFEAGIQNVSVDLLCGVPGQTTQDLKSALAELTAFPITHLSCYLLTLAPHHSMYPELPKDSEQLLHLMTIHDWMTEQGFEHYEISNFARPGFQARHNLAYWKGHSYLGLGPSAHSFDSDLNTREKNVSSLHRYAKTLQENQLPLDTTETLTAEQQELEKWMLALRLNEGFPETWLDKPLRLARAQTLKQEGLLETHPTDLGRLRLTPRGFALSDSVIQALAI